MVSRCLRTGWGIDISRGGMRLFKTMLDADPDLFIHVGDTIYADGPLREEVPLDDGRCGATW